MTHLENASAVLADKFKRTPPPHLVEAAESPFDDGISIRAPKPEDIGGIIRVVQDCKPYLTSYAPYLYFRDIRCFSRTCAVAEFRGGIVGWSLMVPVTDARYFLHQLGVARNMRRSGVAETVIAFQLELLKRLHSAEFELEFTVDRSNAVALHLFRDIATRFRMELHKSADRVRLLEERCAEELYVMRPSWPCSRDAWKNDGSGYSFEA